LRNRDDALAHPAIDPPYHAVVHRALDIAEQDDPLPVGAVLGGVDEALIENEALVVAPRAFDAVDDDVAVVGIRRHRPEVIAQRAGERIAMRAELGAGRQHGKHGAVDGRARFEQRDRVGAEFLRRGQEVVAPFQGEALPAAAEERMEDAIARVRRGA
jgi:hypothetical protein